MAKRSKPRRARPFGKWPSGNGTTIPHLCWHPAPGYRADGNCRACMVEVEGERVLAASCQRKPAPGMKVQSASERAKKSRDMVFELLLADQPEREESHDPASKFWNWVDAMGIEPTSRLPKAERAKPDTSHVAISVNLDACINCGLCVRACREVQMNDVIGMAYRGHGFESHFRLRQRHGKLHLRRLRRVRASLPDGRLDGILPCIDKIHAKARRIRNQERRHALPLLRGRLPNQSARSRQYKIISIDGRDGPANNNRLCVKGRFGFDYIHHPDRLTKPLIRREGVAKDANMNLRSTDWKASVPRSDVGRSACEGGLWPQNCPHTRWRQSARRLRFRQMRERRSVSFPETHPPGFRHQQRRPLHASVSRVVGRRTDGRLELSGGDGAVHGRQRQRLHHRHRRAPGRKPSQSPRPI